MKRFALIGVLLITTLFCTAVQGQEPTPAAQTPQAGAQAADPMLSPAFKAAMKLYRQRHYSQAIEAFDAVLQAEPNNAAAHYFKGYAQYVTGQYEQAVSSFGQAFQADPTFDPRPVFNAR